MWRPYAWIWCATARAECRDNQIMPYMTTSRTMGIYALSGLSTRPCAGIMHTLDRCCHGMILAPYLDIVRQIINAPRKDMSGSGIQIRQRFICDCADSVIFQAIPIQKAIDRLSRHDIGLNADPISCLLYTSPSPRDLSTSRMPSSA